MFIVKIIKLNLYWNLVFLLAFASLVTPSLKAKSEQIPSIRSSTNQVSPSGESSARRLLEKSIFPTNALKEELKIEILLQKEDYQAPLVNNLQDSTYQSNNQPLGTTRGCEESENNSGEILPLFNYQNPIKTTQVNRLDSTILKLPFRVIASPQSPIHISLEHINEERQLLLETINVAETGVLNIQIENLNLFPGEYLLTLATYCQNNPQWYIRSLLISEK